MREELKKKINKPNKIKILNLKKKTFEFVWIKLK